MLYSIKFIMYVNSSVAYFFLQLHLGLKSQHGRISCIFNCPNMTFGLVGMSYMNISRLFSSNVSLKTRNLVMPKEWRFRRTRTRTLRQQLLTLHQVSSVSASLPGICVRSTDHRESHLTQRLHVFSWQIWELLLWS